MRPLTLEQYLGPSTALITPNIRRNAEIMVARANLVLTYYREDNPGAPEIRLASGWRSPQRNAATVGAAAGSAHLSGEAIDLGEAKDSRPFARWCVANLHVLADFSLWMEDPRCTVGKWTSWVHLQTRPSASGLRVFLPNADWAARLKGDSLDAGDLAP